MEDQMEMDHMDSRREDVTDGETFTRARRAIEQRNFDKNDVPRFQCHNNYNNLQLQEYREFVRPRRDSLPTGDDDVFHPPSYYQQQSMSSAAVVSSLSATGNPCFIVREQTLSTNRPMASSSIAFSTAALPRRKNPVKRNSEGLAQFADNWGIPSQQDTSPQEGTSVVTLPPEKRNRSEDKGPSHCGY